MRSNHVPPSHRATAHPLVCRYFALIDGVKALGGTILTFSSMHVSGEQLGRISGIAAILRFAVEDLDDGGGA